MIVIDPPFITKEVWEKFATTARILLEADSKKKENNSLILGTTVAENSDFLFDIFGTKPVAFSPSIPNLVYQYTTFANFAASGLVQKNKEVL